MTNMIITKRYDCQHRTLDDSITTRNHTARMTLADNIKAERERKGLSQVALAKLCGWESQSRISQYEKWVRTPRLDDLRKIASALDVSLVALYVLVKLAPDELPTVRTLRIEGGEMHLLPLNKDFKVAIPESPEILGKVVMIQIMPPEPDQEG